MLLLLLLLFLLRCPLLRSESTDRGVCRSCLNPACASWGVIFVARFVSFQLSVRDGELSLVDCVNEAVCVSFVTSSLSHGFRPRVLLRSF